jgi:hypothetical protein
MVQSLKDGAGFEKRVAPGEDLFPGFFSSAGVSDKFTRTRVTESNLMVSIFKS